MAESQPLQQARPDTSSTTSSSSFKAIAATSGRPPTTAIGGGGPIRATRCYGLKSSPSTPVLPTMVSAIDGNANSRRWMLPSTLQTGASTTASLSGTLTSSSSASGGWWPVERSATVPAGSSSGLVRGSKTSKTISGFPPMTSLMRRSASFETITTSYLSGYWPNYLYYQMTPGDSGALPSTMTGLVARPIVLTFDKSTQTLSDFDELEPEFVRQRTPTHKQRPAQFTDVRSRSNKSRNSPVLLSAGSKGIAIPTIARRNPLVPCQGSAEGFNQEIERLVRNGGGVENDDESSKVVTPDGHRAPIADQLLRMRSVDTQTPSGSLYQSSVSEQRQHPPSSSAAAAAAVIRGDVEDGPASTLPIIPGGDCDEEPEDSDMAIDGCHESSSSPMFVCFVDDTHSRLPPDGREQKIDIKVGAIEHWHDIFFDEPSKYSQQQQQQQQQQSCSPQQQRSPAASSTCHIPSERSAFCPLLKKYIGRHHQIQIGSVSGVVEAQ